MYGKGWLGFRDGSIGFKGEVKFVAHVDGYSVVVGGSITRFQHFNGREMDLLIGRELEGHH